MDNDFSLTNGDQEAAVSALTASIAVRDSIEGLISQQVRTCRRHGVGWQEIAAITHVSKPTAIARWKEQEPMQTLTATEWTLEPGDSIRRVDLHRAFGGSSRGGIAPCKNSDEILLFAEAGEEHGYVDGPGPGGTYDYTGEGQVGDQSMTRGNRAILVHADRGKRLRLFQGARGEVTYLGEYEYVTHHLENARGSHGHGQRKVFVFELRPVNP
jgi:hypothetical protein